MADIRLPMTLLPLFRDLPRRLEVDAASVEEAVAQLEERWPGLRDRLCVPGPKAAAELRPHIHVYVDRERAGLSTGLNARSRVDVIAAISGG
jgi:molybdopterin synthase sulfur carrier subunit